MTAFNTTRRTLLAGAAAIGTELLPYARAQAMPATSVEHPDAALIALGAQLIAADRRRDELDARKDAALEAYVEPELNEAMFWRARDFPSVWTDPDRLDAICREGSERPVYDGSHVAYFRDKLADWRSCAPIGRTYGADDISRVEALVSALEAWVEKDEAIQETIGFTALDRAADVETALIDDLAKQILASTASTADGVCVKARAAGILYAGNPDIRRLTNSLIADASALGQRLPASSNAGLGDRT